MTNLQEKCIQSRLVECGIYFCLVAEGSSLLETFNTLKQIK